jgi:hypothetical protein
MVAPTGNDIGDEGVPVGSARRSRREAIILLSMLALMFLLRGFRAKRG